MQGEKSNKQNQKESNKQRGDFATHVTGKETLSLVFKDLLQISKTESPVKKEMDPGHELSGFKFQLYQLLAVCLWASYSTSLNLGFLVCIRILSLCRLL